MRHDGRYMQGHRGQGSFEWGLHDEVLIPNRAHQVAFLIVPRMDWETISVDLKLEVDQQGLVLATHRFSEDDLINAYEQVHHRVHGYDARGLDPREGPTRLTVGQSPTRW